MNFVDTGYFSFTGKRTGIEVLSISNDISNQLFQLIGHFWYLAVLAGGFVFLLIKLTNRLAPNHSYTFKKQQKLTGIFLLIIFLLFNGFVIRGGFRYRPLQPDHAFIHTPNKLGNLVLNTPYVFINSLAFSPVQELRLLQKKDIIETIKPERAHYYQDKPLKENVVILILESFSAEYIGHLSGKKSYTPFLDFLSDQGVSMKRHYANSRSSINAVPAILSSIPALMDDNYITSVYNTNELHGLGEPLLENGYQTSFFHGARNGSMGFDMFSANAGFENYYGLDEYPGEEDFDGAWGIYDEPFLQFLNATLNESKEPFASVLFTLSSHQPYPIPSSLKNRFPKGKLDIHESIGYTDYALRKFFQTASKQDWYSNTLFIITADHTQALEFPENDTDIGHYHVPLIFFHPNKKLSIDNTQVSQHLDIYPTIMDYLNIKSTEWSYFGRSLFDDTPGKAYQLVNHTYQLIEKNHALQYKLHETSKLYEIGNEEEMILTKNDSTQQRMEKELKSYIQYFMNGVHHNSWYHY